MPYGRILVVDDVETNAYVAKGLLAPYELKIESVGSGYAAIEKIKNGKTYDIIFMDHMMPEMDGIETTKRLREQGYELPIVALTANAVAGQAGIFLGNGFDDFISKPIDLRQMNMLLNKMIRDKQPQEVIDAARKASLEKMDQSTLPKQSDDPEFVKVFIREAAKSLATLEKLFNKENWHEREEDLRLYIIYIHTVKSALANIGKLDLSAVALKLEQAARGRIFEIVLMETKPFFIELELFLEELKRDSAKTRIAETPVAFNREIEGIDIAQGFEQAGSDEAAYVKILRSYAANVRSLLESIADANGADLAEYKKTAHAIKGTSYYIFAEQIARRAEALEKASAAGDEKYVQEHGPDFHKAATKLVRDIEDLIKDYDDENPKPLKDKPDDELLLKLHDACKRFDMDEIDDAMEEMERYRYSSDGGLAETLRSAVNKMDFSEIVACLSALGL